MLDSKAIEIGCSVGIVHFSLFLLQFLSARSFNTENKGPLIYPIQLRVNYIVIGIMVAWIFLCGGLTILGLFTINYTIFDFGTFALLFFFFSLFTSSIYLFDNLRSKAIELTETTLTYKASRRKATIIKKEDIKGFYEETNINLCLFVKNQKKTVKIPLLFKQMDLLRRYIKGIPYISEEFRIFRGNL